MTPAEGAAHLDRIAISGVITTASRPHRSLISETLMTVLALLALPVMAVGIVALIALVLK